ncbi:polyamine aminopropyltransferase [Numidum massiliense]|uniref:polyamine aminopropyltransferase n=1 Tax=Numidum massiliense TaxID=1522315 RepID=UPI0006D54ACA|nr:polyamine aminopropyltransferase [Numidum massiliense]
MQQLPKYVQEKDGKLWLTEAEGNNLYIRYGIKEVVYEKQSPYQHVMIVDSYDFGKMLVLDGFVQTTAGDGFIYNEMIAHLPLSFHPNPQRVLIIGGGDCGAAREVTKYDSVEMIDLVEIDASVVDVCKKHLPEVSGNLSDPRVNYHFTDGVGFVQDVDTRYDVIIVDSSDPVGPAVELFGLDFYKNVYRALNDDGLMVCQSESPLFYADVMQQTYERIDSLFPIAKTYSATVPTYPGGFWSFTLGSKRYDRPHTTFDKEARYVTDGILSQCFQLPQFMQDALRGETNE